MSTSVPRASEQVVGVSVSDDALTVDLRDGRTIMAPLAWFPRLLAASPEQRRDWRISAAGYGIHWPAIDEDISVHGLLRGTAVPRSGPQDTDI
jgi:hypothetical protein